MKLDVEYIDKPFHVVELPLTKVYVIDDYLETSIHHSINQAFTQAPIWSKTNEVRGDSPTGLSHHQFWGASFLRGNDEEDTCRKSLYLARHHLSSYHSFN